MDREYPLVRKERVVRAAMTPRAKKRRASRRQKEYAMVTSAAAAALAACGVKVTRPDPEGLWRVPRWASNALRANIPHATIRTAIRSQKVRRQIEAMIRLGAGTSKVD
jgi:4'-phosphopantetheinyl transferase EntD